MDSIEKRQLILEGKMPKLIFTLAFPIMINNLIQTLYNLGDSMWVGRLGEIEFAATSFVWPVIYVFISLGIGLGIAGNSLISRAIGADNLKAANNYANHLMRISLIAGIALAVIGFSLTKYIVQFMGATDELYKFSVDYLKMSFLGVPFIFLFHVINAVLISQGYTIISMIINGTSAMINLLLDPIFIFETVPILEISGLNLGIKGAAMATVVSQFLSMFVGFLVVGLTKISDIKFSIRNFKFSKKVAKRVFMTATPSAIGMSGSAFGFIIMLSFIASYGTKTLAAFGMINRITDLASMPAMGIGNSLTTIVGQNLGANKPKRVKNAFSTGMKISLAMTMTIGSLLFYFKQDVFKIFLPNADAEMLFQAVAYMKHSLVIIPAVGIFNILQGTFQGSGRTDISMLMDIVRLWGFRIPIVLILRALNFDSKAVWISMSLSNVFVAAMGYYIYKTKNWLKRYA
ncbi:MAG: MATE family efflux transporter [Tissierellia bacterium]|nr:MATE family efflux transporter [Tissierellia bacterium]